ncbi:LysR family transcriptional regulator [Maribellus mangrovi]|uniref:LysR family transcriptional regulator n=1 Tax=Maribellus mangrovi TaxID=3133146 RepID=UPI0030EEA741
MNFSQLEYFREIYLTGSFSGAAKKLGITQPALSLQIQKLEEELDFKLLDRTHRPLKLTQEGEAFYQKSVEILQQIEQLKDVALDLVEEVKGTLRIGIIPTLSPYLVPLYAGLLKKEYPALQTEIFELKTEYIISELKMGQLDIGIISTPISESNLKIEPIFYELFFAYVSEKHDWFKNSTINLDELDENDIWYLEEGNCFQNQVNSICNITQKKQSGRNLLYRCNSIDSLRRIVENESGITFIPELATINIPSEQEEMIKDFEQVQPVREISIITLKKHTKERQIGALKSAIISSIPKRMLIKPDTWIVDTQL